MGGVAGDDLPGVESWWVMACEGDEGAGFTWRIVPDVHPHLVVSRYPSGRVRASVVGARSRWVDADQSARLFTIGVRLAPGALRVLGVDVAEDLVDRSVSVSDLFGGAGDALRRRLEDAEDPGTACGVALDFVGGRVRGGDGIDWRVQGFWNALEADPHRAVGDLAREIGLSARTLRKTLRAHVGLSPKTAQRVRRLQRALVPGVLQAEVRGGTLAHRGGYADQAHFIRECRALLGETPRTFLARGADSFNRETGTAS